MRKGDAGKGMKILHLLYESEGDYFGIGGVGTRAYAIYEYLKDRHDITLLCKKYPGARDGERNGLRHIFVGTDSKSLMTTLLSYAYHAAQFVKRKGSEYDVIVEDFSPAIPTFLHAVTQKPVVLQIQGYTGALYFKKYNLVYASFLCVMEHLRPRFYRNFILVNREIIRRLSLPSSPFSRSFSGDVMGGVSLNDSEHIAIISNGISPGLSGSCQGEGDYILYLGRIDIYGKGLDVLVNAYAEFFRSFPHIRLVIAGDGRDREEFGTLLATLPEDVRKNIELRGWVSGERKKEVIGNALFVVLPSRHEAQSIVALEAMACGKAVIVSGIPEFSFVSENGTGMFFKPGNAGSLARSMKELASSHEREGMGVRGRNWVKQFTWDRISAKYEEFLYGVLAS